VRRGPEGPAFATDRRALAAGRHARWALAAAVLALALAPALAACGGDDEDSAGEAERAPTTTEPAPTETEEAQPGGDAAPTEAEPPPEAPDDEPESPGEALPSPEDQPGGAGDEEPARSLALFSGEDGRITPRTVRVPAYISIRVELSSEDGQEYGLTFEGETIRVSGGLASVSTTIDGLRPGESVVGTPTGPGNRVRIEATAEPGP
jgi:hypothetical protein